MKKKREKVSLIPCVFSSYSLDLMLNIKQILSEIKYIFLLLHFTHRTVQWRWGTTVRPFLKKTEDTKTPIASLLLKLFFTVLQYLAKAGLEILGPPYSVRCPSSWLSLQEIRQECRQSYLLRPDQPLPPSSTLPLVIAVAAS